MTAAGELKREGGRQKREGRAVRRLRDEMSAGVGCEEEGRETEERRTRRLHFSLPLLRCFALKSGERPKRIDLYM